MAVGRRGAVAVRIVIVGRVVVVERVVVVWRRRRGAVVVVGGGVAVVPGVDAAVGVFLAGREVTVSWHFLGSVLGKCMMLL